MEIAGEDLNRQLRFRTTLRANCMPPNGSSISRMARAASVRRVQDRKESKVDVPMPSIFTKKSGRSAPPHADEERTRVDHGDF